MPANWAASGGTWSVSNGLISPSSGQGYATMMTFSQYYNLMQRTARISFEVLSSGTVMGFGTVLSNNASATGTTLVTVDASNNTLNIGNGGTAGSNPGILASVPLGFSVTVGHTYVLSVTQNLRQLIVMISDPVSGKVTSIVSGDNASDTGLTAPFGTNDDYPSFVGIAGQFKIDNFTIVANASSPQVMFIGDSITWEIQIPVSQTWPQIVGQQIPRASFVISGRPGATSYGVLGRIFSEVSHILPKYLVVMIGTNDAGLVPLANYESNINAIVTQAQGLGIQVVICTVPTSGGEQSNINAENAFLLGLSGVTFVRADIATSVGGDGHTQNTALFGSDLTHPNALGAAAIAARFRTDVPAIFN